MSTNSKNNRKSNSRFQRGSGKYTCLMCGKQTRETGEGESGCQLCLDCFEYASWENTHNDEAHGLMDHDGTIIPRVEGCLVCEKELAVIKHAEEAEAARLDEAVKAADAAVARQLHADGVMAEEYDGQPVTEYITYACSWCHHEMNADGSQGSMIPNSEWGTYINHGICHSCKAKMEAELKHVREQKQKEAEQVEEMKKSGAFKGNDFLFSNHANTHQFTLSGMELWDMSHALTLLADNEDHNRELDLNGCSPSSKSNHMRWLAEVYMLRGLHTMVQAVAKPLRASEHGVVSFSTYQLALVAHAMRHLSIQSSFNDCRQAAEQLARMFSKCCTLAMQVDRLQEEIENTKSAGR